MAQTADNRLTLAWLSGTVGRLVKYRELTVEERADAVAEVRSVTTRPDLLAELAAVMRGVASSRLAPPEVERHERVAELLIEAGADTSLLAHWAEVGRKRVETARAIPNTGIRR